MTWEQAYLAMEQKKYVRRPHWEKAASLALNDTKTLALLHWGRVSDWYTLTLEDKNANDWEAIAS